MPRAWLDRALVEAVHAETIAEFGGEPGLRDAGLLVAALARLREVNRDARELAEKLEPYVGQYCSGLAATPYHVHRFCG
jgi:hypothetical protein